MQNAVKDRGRYQCVLTLHGVGVARRSLEPGEGQMWIDRTSLSSVLDEVAVDPCQIKLTIDDGNESDMREVLPMLIDRGLRATFFVCAGRIGRDGFLTAADLRRLVDFGMTIGSHGWSHVDWRQLDEPGRRREWRDARSALEDAISAPIAIAACPFGHYDRVVVRGVRAAGFETLYTSDRGWTSACRWLRARNTVVRGMDGDGLRRLVRTRTVRARMVTEMRMIAKRLRGAPSDGGGT